MSFLLSRLLDQMEKDTINLSEMENEMGKHRFLVQAKIIDKKDYQRIGRLPLTEKADELTKLWEGSKGDTRHIKLNVEFKFPATPEVVTSELHLRKKYDAVVEYTVHLTAERDTLINELERVQTELKEEKSKRKDNNELHFLNSEHLAFCLLAPVVFGILSQVVFFGLNASHASFLPFFSVFISIWSVFMMLEVSVVYWYDSLILAYLYS